MYTATIGLGIALRGLNDLDGAEAQYKKAQQIDPQRGDAYYNMGVLYKDFRANKTNDPDPRSNYCEISAQVLTAS